MSTKSSENNVQDKLANIAAERAVLAGICRYGIDSYVEVSPILNEESFTIDYNKVLYRCLQNLLKNTTNVDFSGILSSAHELGLAEFVNKNEVLKHIRGVIETPINLENVFEHAAKIRRLQFGRDIQNSLRETYRAVSAINGSESLSTILAIAEKPLQDLSTRYVKEENNLPHEIGKNLDSYIDNLLENPCDIVGLPTGFAAYDKLIGGGLRRKCVDVVAARPGVGKSVFCDNVALNVASLGVPVLVLDTEMSEEDHFARMIANIASVPIEDISTGRFGKNPTTKAKVLEAKAKLKNLPYFYISIAGRPFSETISIIKRWLLKEVGYDENSRMKDCLVIYDYLKLMSADNLGGSGDLKEYQLLGFQITELHNLTVEYDFPCLTFCQLNRDGITKESTDTVSGSDRIIWLCTSFSIFKAKSEEEIATDGIMAGNRKIAILKSRHGAGANLNTYVCLNMEGQYARLVHLGTVSEIGGSGKFEEKEDSEE